MTATFSNLEVPFASTEHHAAAIIARVSYGNLHAGISYRRTNGGVFFLHLASNDDLQNDWVYHPFCWATPDVVPEKQHQIGNMCQRIISLYRREKGKVPDNLRKALLRYGLVFSQSRFSPKDASIQLGEDATGLTCATFILAVFNSVGLMLVDEGSWKVRRAEDIEWARTVHPSVRESIMSEVQRGVIRIRAEEVVGACACIAPVHFDSCLPESLKVLQLLPPAPAAS